MKSCPYLLAVLFATCAPAYAQTGLIGTWRAEGVGKQPGWELFLFGDEPELRGRVNHCATTGRANGEIYDLNVSGNTITFKCTSNDQSRTITFTGTIRGDEITFAWKKSVRADEFDYATDPRFGASAPPQFTVTRVPDGELAKIVQDGVLGMEFTAAVNLLRQNVKARGTLFVPQKAARVRAVFVAIEFGLGARLFEAPQWLKLAETLEGALLLVQVTGIGPSVQNDLGTGMVGNIGGADVLPPLLQRLAQESGRQELSDAPLLFWGHSGAGTVATTFADRFPERTLAFVRYHTGPTLGGDLSVVTQIPALFLAGGKDDRSIFIDGAETLWKRGRAVGAPWTFALDPDATHGGEEYLKRANDLMLPWIRAVVLQRLSADSAALRAVTDRSAWMGNNLTREVAAYGSFPGLKSDASWLPDEPSARGWQVVLRSAK
jgi:hypothetical protein